jgi:hypothetical protein
LTGEYRLKNPAKILDYIEAQRRKLELKSMDEYRSRKQKLVTLGYGDYVRDDRPLPPYLLGLVSLAFPTGNADNYVVSINETIERGWFIKPK